MALTATNRADLRRELCAMLKSQIPDDGVGLSSDSKQFTDMLGKYYGTENLKKLWKEHPEAPVTCCNPFVGWVAAQIRPSGVLVSGRLDLRAADREVPGCWIDAGLTPDSVHPQPGDFYQTHQHVAVVVEIDPETQWWRWVAGGQGGPPQGRDYIRWGPWQPASSRTFREARPKVKGWIDIGVYYFPNELRLTLPSIGSGAGWRPGLPQTPSLNVPGLPPFGT